MPPPLGQHFLKNPTPARVLCESLEITAQDTVVEIGPGRGALTKFLIKAQPKKLILIERDIVLAADLVRLYREQGLDWIEVVHGDVREVLPELAPILPEEWKLAGNIPYYITSRLLRIIGTLESLPLSTSLLIQKEVAERIVVQPPHMNKLAAHVGVWAESSLLMEVPPSYFSPPPKVDSMVISLSTKKEVPALDERELYSKVVNILFKQPRKVLGNNLADGISSKTKQELLGLLEPFGITPTTRGQDLSVETIQALSMALRDLVE